jgi:glucose dehydrogenase
MNEIPYLGIIYGLIGIFLFRFRNQQQKLLNTISILIMIIFSIEPFFFSNYETIGKIIWAIAGLGLVIAYYFRLKSKLKREIIDYLKLVGVALIAIYPINFYTYDYYLNRWDILIVIAYLILPMVLTVFIYDRYILKPERMKTKFILILVFQLLVILVSFTYALVQQTEAKRMERGAVENAIQAEKNAEEAKRIALELENCRNR